MIGALNATTYTCPLYASLLSLPLVLGESLIGRRILCMSYGSGCAASMYGLEASACVPIHRSDIVTRLRSRLSKPIEDTLLLVDAFEMTHG